MIVLPFTHADLNLPANDTGMPRRSSISGVQDKVELRRSRGEFSVVEKGGEYILKPIPSIPLPRFHQEVPLNEALTMRIAARVFGIATAANEVVSFSDGELAYLTRRFDYRAGVKIRQEDFCQLSGRTSRTHGSDYKYNASYEECAQILRRFCPAHLVEIPKLFRRVLFSYVFGNGDAHLKNFSLYESLQGDMVLTPAYDLLATSVHIPAETPLALDLFADGHFTAAFERLGFYSSADFLELGRVYGLSEARARRELELFCTSREAVAAEIASSYLGEEAKTAYAALYRTRLEAIAQ